MEPTSYNEIAGWAEDRHAEALTAFRRSCPRLTAGPDMKIATDGGEEDDHHRRVGKHLRGRCRGEDRATPVAPATSSSRTSAP